MFESPEPLSPGSRLEIELYTPIDCEKRVRFYMRIGAESLWTSEIPEAFGHEGSNRYRVGVVFDQIDPQDQACCNGYVKRRLMREGVQRIA